MALPFTNGTSGGGSSGDTSHNGPGAEQAGINGSSTGPAPGGRWPDSDLPMDAAPGNGSGWSEGFSPSPTNAPANGDGLPPAGNRR